MERYTRIAIEQRNRCLKNRMAEIEAAGDDPIKLRKVATEFADGYENACAREHMDRIRQDVERSKELADTICNAINSGNFNEKMVFEAMDNQHRELQSRFGSFCLKWFNHCLQPEYRTDGRNEWLVIAAKKLRETNLI